MENTLLTLIRDAGKKGLQINEEKIKYLVYTRREKPNIKEIKIGENCFEKVSLFKYIGVIITTNNN